LCPSYGVGETDPVKAEKLLKFELAPGATNPYAAASAAAAGSGAVAQADVTGTRAP
jgi:endonuclease-3